MKKNIYRVRLKKILVSMLLIIILFQVMMPSMVFAGTTTKRASYSDWLNHEDAKGYEEKIEEITINKLRDTWLYETEQYNGEEVAKKIAKEQYLSKPDALILEATLKKGKALGFLWDTFSFKIEKIYIKEELVENTTEVEKSYYELLEWTGQSSVDVDPIIIERINKKLLPGTTTYIEGVTVEEFCKNVLELNKSSMILTVIGTKDSYEILNFKVPEKNDSELLKETEAYMGLNPSENKDAVIGGVSLQYSNGTYTATGTIQGVMTSIQTLCQSNEGYSIASIRGRWASESELSNYKSKVKEEILKYLKKNNYIDAGQNEEKVVDNIYKFYKNDQSIKVTVGGNYEPSPGTLEVQNVSITLDKAAVSRALDAGEIEDVDITADEVDKYDQKTEVDVDKNGKEIEDEDEDSADLGGILLSPLFSLVNFIADSIMCLLQNTMLPSESIGWSVMKSSKMSISGASKSAEVVLADDAVVLGGLLKSIKWPHITYTPEKIFSGQVDLLSIDFITGKDNDNDGWQAIRTVISQWYNVLRMVAIIGLLSVLIYTGIKILISANANDKAKYKEWIINWIVAVGILFFMHYIMALIVYSTNEFSGLLTDACGKIVVKYKGNSSDTNLMGAVRFMIQSDNFYAKVGYEVMYIALIVYTIKFTFIYLKRVLNMAFLTLIAPIVALTYPLDKINDGKAQGFDMWLKEYIFNALLQPMHQIMYYILMGSAISIAAENPLYGIVVLAFLTEAERLLKKIFGFDKAGGGTVGGMGSAFAAGAIASNIAKLAKLPKGNASKGGPGGSDNGESNYMDMLKPEKDSPVSDNFENLLDDGAPENGAGGSGTPSGAEENVEPDNDDGQENQENQDNQVVPPQPANGSGAELQPDSDSGGEPNNPEENGQETANNKKAIQRGIDNVKYKAKRKLGMFTGDKDYNKHVWKRRAGRTLKKGLRMAGGAALGLTAAAVQAGISITDGKYNPMEGIGAFTAGYAGGGRVVDQIGGKFGSLANTFNEGYYSGDEGKAKLLEKRKQQFMFDDKVDQAYRQKYQDNPDKAKKMKELARDQLVPFGVTDPKDQFAVQKFAEEIVKKKGENLNAEQKEALLGQAIDQGRRTQGFIDNLTAQGQQKAINDPGQQQKYIEAQLKAAGVTAESERGQTISRNLNNAFKSAAVYQQINRKR